MQFIAKYIYNTLVYQGYSVNIGCRPLHQLASRSSFGISFVQIIGAYAEHEGIDALSAKLF